MDERVSLQKRVVAWLAEQPVDVYLVGGSVRDRLLGRPIYDLDAVLPGGGLAMARRLANDFRGAFYALDEDRDTGRVILQDEEGGRFVVDLARYRAASLEADLEDRDFTVNALAVLARAPERVIDLHGGSQDLADGLIRTVSERSIRDDPLRAMRAVRQALELGFSLASETEELIIRDGAGLVQVSEERQRDELARLLVHPRAALALDHLDRLAVLGIVLPELEALRGLHQPPPHHLDVLAHSIATVKALEGLLCGLGVVPPLGGEAPIAAALAPFADRVRALLHEELGDVRTRLVTLKLVALLHDVGKATATTAAADDRLDAYAHPHVGAAAANNAFRRLRFSATEARLGHLIVLNHMRPLMLSQQAAVSQRAVYRFFRDTRGAGVDVLLHGLADHLATYAGDSGGDEWSRLMTLTERMFGDYFLRGEERTCPPPIVDGHDLQRVFGLAPGPQIGRLLELVREAQVAGEVDTHAGALDLVRRHLAEGSGGAADE